MIWPLLAIICYFIAGVLLWGITKREEMVVFWLPVLVVGVVLWLRGD